MEEIGNIVWYNVNVINVPRTGFLQALGYNEKYRQVYGKVMWMGTSVYLFYFFK